MQDYEDWTTEPIPDTLDKAYEKALAKLEKCLPFEDALVRNSFFSEPYESINRNIQN